MPAHPLPEVPQDISNLAIDGEAAESFIAESGSASALNFCV